MFCSPVLEHIYEFFIFFLSCFIIQKVFRFCAQQRRLHIQMKTNARYPRIKSNYFERINLGSELKSRDSYACKQKSTMKISILHLRCFVRKGKKNRSGRYYSNFIIIFALILQRTFFHAMIFNINVGSEASLDIVLRNANRILHRRSDASAFNSISLISFHSITFSTCDRDSFCLLAI